MINKAPNDFTICNLQVLLLPNGEVMFLGKTIGWIDHLGKYLFELPKENVNGNKNNKTKSKV